MSNLENTMKPLSTGFLGNNKVKTGFLGKQTKANKQKCISN